MKNVLKTLSEYLSSNLLQRTANNLLLCIAFPSILEALERQVSMPLAMTLSTNASLWVLSWPFYVSLFLPGCFFAAIISQLLTYTKSNEYQMFIAVGWSGSARGKLMLTHASILCIFLLGINGWLLPLAQSTQTGIIKNILEEHSVPKFIPNQFNTFKAGSKTYLVFPFQKSGKIKKAYLIEEAGEQDMEKEQSTIYAIENMIFSKDPQPELHLHNGSTYLFKDHVLRQKMGFDVMQMPITLKAKKMYRDNTEIDLQTATSLWQNKGSLEKSALWWRINQAVAVLVLTIVAIALTPLYLCQQRPRALMLEAVFIYLTYFAGLLLAKTQAGLYAEGAIFYYLSAHTGVLLITALFMYGNSRWLRCY